MILLLALMLAAQVAQAPSNSDGGTPSADDAQLQKELESAIGKDQAAAPARGAGAQSPQAPAQATQATNDQPAPPPPNLLRGTQSLNPDLSAIIDAVFGYQRRAPAFQAGDDPDLGAQQSTKAVGPGVQEVELAFSAIVDPYFKGEVYLTIPNLSGLEVEEAFATTTSLPWNLQVKMGSFRSAIGRQNGQHLHVQDFTRRPLVNAAFLGDDGLRGAAAQLSWLSPLPFYLALFGEVRKPNAPAVPTLALADLPPPVHSFGGGSASDLTFVGAAKAFFPIGEEVSVYGGLNFANGTSPGVFVVNPNGPASTLGAARGAVLVGGDLYVKWKPPNVSQGYDSLAWQTEAFFRHFNAGNSLPDEWDGGMYSQLVYQLSRRWAIGVRGDLIGIPTSTVLGRTVRGATSLTFQPSEFARVRGYLEAENSGTGSSVSSQGQLIPAATPGTAVAAFLQLEVSIGAHGAHPF